MPLTKENIADALRTIRDASTKRDLVALGAVKKIASCDGYVSLTIACDEEPRTRSALRGGIEAVVREAARGAGEELRQVTIDFVRPDEASVRDVAVDSAGREVRTAAGGAGPVKQAASSATTGAGAVRAGNPSLPGVKHIIAVGAGKGGVGKSTVSVNLAVGLARQGHAVGLLDGDIYGPSAPTMLGLESMEVTLHKNMLQVFYVHGIKAMTIGKLVDREKPLIWRGPMAHGAFKQLVEQTEWGDLDYLIIDLPPGTGDVSLTMAQLLAVSGAVVVCTPQKVAQDDAVRAARMFQQLNIPVLGVVENMSFFIGDDGKEYDLFGRGGAQRMAQRLGLPFLGEIPISMNLRINSDAGNPSANFDDPRNATLRAALENMVHLTETQVALVATRTGSAGPMLSVS